MLMQQTVTVPPDIFHEGRAYSVDDQLANEWNVRGIAKPFMRPTISQRAFRQFFAQGAGKPCLYLPWTGEFGWKIAHRIRLVHFHPASFKLVCVKPGEQVLYPSADGFITHWTDPIPDKMKSGTGRAPVCWRELAKDFPAFHPVETGALTSEQERDNPIRLNERIPFSPHRRGLKADIVLGIRHREFCPQKNWPREHWQTLADAFIKAGYTVGVAGKRPYTLDVDGQAVHAGDYDDTDAQIELLQNCNLYIGSDTGVSHLAAAVGCRMLVFREEASQQRDWLPRMAETNPGRVSIVRSWDSPAALLRAATDMLKGQANG